METAGDPDDFMPVYDALDKDDALYKAVSDVISSLKSDKIAGGTTGDIPLMHQR